MMRKTLLAVLPLLVLAGCETVGGPGGSNYYDCRDGEMLKVTMVPNGAVMKAGKRPAVALRSVPGVGSTFENKKGYRLQIMGDTATWSGMTREAPHTCSRVAVPR